MRNYQQEKAIIIKKSKLNEAPPQLKEILEIEGVKGVYHVLDFIAVERSGRYDWKDILPKVRAVFGEGTGKFFP